MKAKLPSAPMPTPKDKIKTYIFIIFTEQEESKT
jgi:hypothetical protein